MKSEEFQESLLKYNVDSISESPKNPNDISNEMQSPVTLEIDDVNIYPEKPGISGNIYKLFWLLMEWLFITL